MDMEISITKPEDKSSYLAVQSNALVNARYRMTLAEQKLFFLLMARIHKNDKDFQTYRVSLSELINALGGARKDMYNRTKKLAKSLLSKQIEIENTIVKKYKGEVVQHKEWYISNLLSSARYIQIGTLLDEESQEFACESALEMRFDPDLKKHLLQLKENFTQADIRTFLSATSSYSMRIYWFLKQVERIGYRVFELEELKQSLQVTNYSRFNDFKRRVLEPARKDLLENSDLYFDFEGIKTGRKITHIKMIVRKNKKTQSSISLTQYKTEPAEVTAVIEDLQSLGFTVDKARQYTAKLDLDFIIDVISHTQIKINKKEIKTSPAIYAEYFLQKQINPKPNTEKITAKQALERQNKHREILQSRLDGNRLYDDFNAQIKKEIDILVANVTEEEKQVIKDNLEGFEKNFIIRQGKLNTRSPLFRIKLARLNNVLSGDDAFVEWAQNSHNVSISKYTLTDSEKLLYANQIPQEGWQVSVE